MAHCNPLVVKIPHRGALSLAAAIVIAVPLAVWLAEKRRPAELVLQGTGVLQTIPSLALLGLLIPLVGIGSPPILMYGRLVAQKLLNSHYGLSVKIRNRPDKNARHILFSGFFIGYTVTL